MVVLDSFVLGGRFHCLCLGSGLPVVSFGLAGILPVVDLPESLQEINATEPYLLPPAAVDIFYAPLDVDLLPTDEASQAPRKPEA